MQNVYRPCPICNSVCIENIERISFKIDFMPDFYFLAKCTECGFIYANSPATLRDYEKYYELNNRYGTLPTQEKSCEKTYNLIVNILNKYSSKEDRILDIGCGGGEMLKLLKRDGFKNLAGLDPSIISIDKLVKAEITGIRGTVYDKPEMKMLGYFNTIILSGVLEHLYDLKNAIMNAALYLKKGGKVICAIPNALEYDVYSYPLPHYVNVEHINHFSPNSLIKLFSDSGFSLLECISTTIDFNSTPDPVLFATFKYEDPTNVAYQSIKSILLKNNLELSSLNSAIDNLSKSKKKVAVFGTGNFARFILANTKLNDINIVCFLDNDSSMYNKTFCGYKVNSPSFLKEFNGEVLILSMNGYLEIKKQLHDMGFKNIISLD